MIDRLILWRHGRTEWNASARFQGQQDPDLDSLGAAQAKAAAPILATLRPSAIYSSDLGRAVQTAAELSALTALPVGYDKRLRETSMGKWEGLTRDEVAVQFPEELRAWQSGQVVRRGGGETATEVADRAQQFVESIDATNSGTVVLVAHGGTHKALASRLLGLAPEQWMILAPLSNCHWTQLRRDPSGVSDWRLKSHNVGPLAKVVTQEEAAAEQTPNVDSDEGATTYRQS